MRKCLQITVSFLLLCSSLFAQPRWFWAQLPAADTTGSIAIALPNGNGIWSDSLRWWQGQLRIGQDTAATRAYARSVGFTESGTANTLPLWSTSASLGDSWLSQASNRLQLASQKVFNLGGGTLAQRPTGILGDLYYNTDDNRRQWHNGTGWYYTSPWVWDSSDEIIFNEGGEYLSITDDGIIHFPTTALAKTNFDAYGVGRLLGYQNSGFRVAMGVGVQLGYQNSGQRFSGGAGYLLGYSNSGSFFSGGAGYALGYDNSGPNFSAGAGYFAAYQNSGGNVALGAGYFAAYQNSGDRLSVGAGVEAAYQNNASDLSIGAGYRAAYQNSGQRFSGGAGYFLGYLNKGDDSAAGAGYRAAFSNSGDKSTFNGANSGYFNKGDESTFSGYRSGYLNNGSYSTGIGALSLEGNQQDSVTAVGYQAGGFVRNVALSEVIDSVQLDAANNLITVLDATKWGSVGDTTSLETYGFTIGDPGFSTLARGVQQYAILNDTTVELLSGDVITPIIDNFSIAPGLQYSNYQAFGAFAKADKDNQVILGNDQIDEVKLGPTRFNTSQNTSGKDGYGWVFNETSGQTELSELDFVSTDGSTLSVGNYTWNVDQSVGVSQENYTSVYNDDTGEIELKPSSLSTRGQLVEIASESMSTGATFTRFTGLSSQNLSNFTATDSTLTYTGIEDVLVEISYSGNIYFDVSSAGTYRAVVKPYVNGGFYNEAISDIQISTDGAENWLQHISGTTWATLSTNDVISLRYTATAGGTYSLFYLSLTVKAL